MANDVAIQIEKIRRAIVDLETQQRELGIDYSAHLAQLNARLVGLQAGRDVNVGEDVVGRDKITNQAAQIVNIDSGVVAAGGGTAAGAGGVVVSGDVHGDIYIGAASSLKALPLTEALRYYLDNLIETYRCLHLQGIRAGSQPLSIDLEKVYVSLKAIKKHTGVSVARSRGEIGLMDTLGYGLTVAAALQHSRRLVIIGDPGCGKTTLLAYLALTYARTLRDGADLVHQRLQMEEPDHLPILLPLRDFGRHLKEKHPNAGLDGPALLLNYLREYYAAQSIPLPEDFFDLSLDKGRVVVLLDGMDEVAEPGLRQRVARIIEKFAVRYPTNRFVVTSRIVGYDGAARIGADFGLAQVCEFNVEEVRQFLRDWTRTVETTLAGNDSEPVVRLAAEQAGRLIKAVENNRRVADLAVNPLLLTVIALVHRYRAQLPERRSELYEEAVEVLLDRWDEAKGMDQSVALAGRELDAGDRRSKLVPVAFWMHEQKRREIELDELRSLLLPLFSGMVGDDKDAVGKAVDSFLWVINERSGLLVERGMGVYGFAHLTFQEYLAARALADRDDAQIYTLECLGEPWWRETILLEAGYLSTQGPARVSRLIRAIMDADPRTEPEPCHHLLLAAECLFDVGAARVDGDLLGEVKRRLQKEADSIVPEKAGREKRRAAILRKVAAMNALNRVNSGALTASKFWKAPWGEPEWVTVPAGEFWMGSEVGASDEQLAHRVSVAEFKMAVTPITNTQYALFVSDAKTTPPEHWRSGQAPPGKENHPVVNVNWYDAQAYCRWLSSKTGQMVSLPTDVEWEKAARGSRDKREYPWGEWAELRCNSEELDLGDTSPVGLFLNGASPYGCLDMVGNVWEWTLSKYKAHPYGADYMDDSQVLRGGSFNNDRGFAHCTFRLNLLPDFRDLEFGFRVVVVSPDSHT